MLKLTKYELRKNLLGIGIVAGIICVLQALFMFFCLTENLNYTSLFGGLLIIAASVSSVSYTHLTLPTNSLV